MRAVNPKSVARKSKYHPGCVLCVHRLRHPVRSRLCHGPDLDLRASAL